MAVPDLSAGLQVFERGWLSANNILFISKDNTLLVDSGYCTHAEQTLELVESALGAHTLDTLVNTHLHSDHCGGNAALQARYPKLQTFIPPGHAQQVAEWDPVALTYLPTGQLCPQFSFTHVLKPGSVMQFGSQHWELHSAPGHDPHSLVFFEPVSRVLISADALWENGFGVVFPELEGADAFAEVDTTLNLIERLNPRTVIPGHGRVFAYAPEIMARARQRLESFISNPPKHAHHAAKVLLKFKLLETQCQDFDEFAQWAIETPYFSQLKAKFFADLPIRTWVEQLSAELVTAGVARKDGAHILNA